MLGRLKARMEVGLLGWLYSFGSLLTLADKEQLLCPKLGQWPMSVAELARPSKIVYS